MPKLVDVVVARVVGEEDAVEAARLQQLGVLGPEAQVLVAVPTVVGVAPEAGGARREGGGGGGGRGSALCYAGPGGCGARANGASRARATPSMPSTRPARS